MADQYPCFVAAAVQASPVFLDREATVAKACDLIAEAARHGAQLVVFPEAYIPAFPLWALIAAPYENHHFFIELYNNAVKVPGPDVDQLCRAAHRHGVYLSIGINEKADISMGAIYNTNLLIGPDGTLISKHRKLMPTYAEKLVRAPGDASGLGVYDTAIGRVGMLICGENTNPLARYALLAQGEQVHISTYPPCFPVHPPGTPGQYDVESAIRIRAGAHSFEGKVFNIVSSGVLSQQMIERMGDTPIKREIMETTPRAVSMILDPNGELIAGPLVGQEGIIYGTIDIGQSIGYKQVHDVVGYYNRFDIFRLHVDRRPQPPIEIRMGSAAQAESSLPDEASPEAQGYATPFKA